MIRWDLLFRSRGQRFFSCQVLRFDDTCSAALRIHFVLQLALALDNHFLLTFSLGLERPRFVCPLALFVDAYSTHADCGTLPATAACRFTYGSGERLGSATVKPRRRGVGREGDRAANENVALRQPRRGRQDLEVNRQIAW